jgi:hypothetical protein
MADQTSSENLSQLKLNRFVKSLVLASKEVADERKESAKEGMQENIESIRETTATLHPAKKKKILFEIRKLEKKIDEVINKEGAILFTEQRKGQIDDSLKQDIHRIESRISELSEKDARVITALVSEIKSLESALAQTEQKRLKESVMSKTEIGTINQSMSDLRDKIKQFMTAREEREKRVEEIERKIKHRVDKNFEEIVSIELLLTEMEKRLEDMKGKYSKGIVQQFEEKISWLKQKLVMRKAGIGAEEEKFMLAGKKPDVIMRPPTIPTGPVKFIRHDMMIKPIEEHKRKLAEMPSAPEIPEDIAEELKKEHVEKLGRLKALFAARKKHSQEKTEEKKFEQKEKQKQEQKPEQKLEKEYKPKYRYKPEEEELFKEAEREIIKEEAEQRKEKKEHQEFPEFPSLPELPPLPRLTKEPLLKKPGMLAKVKNFFKKPAKHPRSLPDISFDMPPPPM